MLTVAIPESEYYDESKGEFIKIKRQVLQLEHSLVSISKWESKWCKPFLSNKTPKTTEEILDYIRCMTITSNVDPEVYKYLTKENFDEIDKYIEAPMTATWFNDKASGRSTEIITSELIYYWMISFNIPMECQKWHLNRLLILIRVCSIKNAPQKKMSKREIMNQNASLNAARRSAMNSKG